MITNLGHQMIRYIERKNRTTSMGETVQYSNQLISNWARARRYKYKRGPVGIKERARRHKTKQIARGLNQKACGHKLKVHKRTQDI